MNKVALTIAVVAACVAATYAVPAPRIINWTDVTNKVNEISTLVQDSAQQIITLANNDNAQVGSSIASKIDNTRVAAEAILQQANDAIAAQTLTDAQARQLTGQLKGEIGKLRGLISDDLALLTPAVAVQVRQIVSATFDGVTLKSEELSALLRQ